MPNASRLTAVPDADWGSVAAWNIFGGAIARYLAVGDNNAATGISATAFGATYSATLGAAGVPAGSTVTGIICEARGYYVAPGRCDLVLLLVWIPTLEVIAQSAPFAILDVDLTNAYWTAPPLLLRPDGQPLTDADVANNILVQVQAYVYDGATAKITQLQVGVYYNQPPVIVATLPTAGATITDTAQPTVGGTYSDGDGDAMEALHVRVFSGTGAVDPDSETARLVYEWIGYAGAFSHHIGTSLANGGYTWAARASDAGSNLRFSAWVTSTFTVNVTPPGAPTVSSATWDAAGQRIALAVTAPAIASGPPPEWYELQQSRDGGLTWEEAMDRYPVPNLVGLVDSMTIQHQDVSVAAQGWAVGANSNQTNTVATSGDAVFARSAAAGDYTSKQAAGHECVVTAGRTYRAYCTVGTVNGTRNIAMSIDWLNAGGGVISTSTGPNTSAPAGVFTLLTAFDAVAPAGAVKARLNLISRAALAANEITLWNDIHLWDTSITVYDERAWRKASVQVRIRSGRRPAVFSRETAPPSAWVTNTVATTSDGRTWIKSFASPALNYGFRLADDAEVAAESEGRVAAFPVWGQRGLPATYGVPLGWSGPLVLATATDAEFAALDALYRSGGVALVMTDKGESPRRQYWASIAKLGMVERSRSVVGAVERQWRIVTLELTEAPDPLTA